MANEKRLIDANELKYAMYSIKPIPDSECIFIDVIIDEIDNAQTVDAVEVVHGWWKPVAYNVHCSCGKTHKTYHYECSACKRIAYAQPYGLNYCPNCGAKMDGDANG